MPLENFNYQEFALPKLVSMKQLWDWKNNSTLHISCFQQFSGANVLCTNEKTKSSLLSPHAGF